MKLATLRDFDSGSYTATVEIAGSVSSYLSGVPVARNIDAGELSAGRRVAVFFFDPMNPASAVVMAVWE